MREHCNSRCFCQHGAQMACRSRGRRSELYDGSGGKCPLFYTVALLDTLSMHGVLNVED